jgi:hypothetical protein
VNRRLLVVAALCSLALVLPASALAASRMLVGFMDDANFRWADDRMQMLNQAQAANAQVIRTIANWRTIAPTRPASAANPFDPAYNFADLDEFVREAQQRDIEILISVWGTPGWANGRKGPNVAPRRMADLRNFAQAVAARYSGRFAGYPGVRYFSLWNESNLEQFLAPQYDARGRSVGPQTYARMYRAAYAGYKRGNPLALVAAGETSPQGRDRPSPGRAQDSHSPGRFAQLVAESRPRVKFDAWAHHPYPTRPGLAPTQRVRWPNVTLTSMARFERSLDSWFGRTNVRVWITEYGHETRPPGPEGVSPARQRTYARQALTMARRDERVTMFIWFVIKDQPGNKWSSGLLARNGARKPAFATFAALARAVDGRNPLITVRAGRANPTVSVPAVLLAASNPPGARIGVTYQVVDGRRLVVAAQPEVPLTRLGYLTFRAGFRPVAGRTYRVAILAVDINGNEVSRTAWLRAVR